MKISITKISARISSSNLCPHTTSEYSLDIDEQIANHGNIFSVVYSRTFVHYIILFIK